MKYNIIVNDQVIVNFAWYAKFGNKLFAEEF